MLKARLNDKGDQEEYVWFDSDKITHVRINSKGYIELMSGATECIAQVQLVDHPDWVEINEIAFNKRMFHTFPLEEFETDFYHPPTEDFNS